MPHNRPRIPAEIEREVMIESGRRCAVCGAQTPLERAHIIPWHKSRQHRAEDLVCLCANCHERSHKENWGEKELREYKKNPWIVRVAERNDLKQKQKVKISIDMELENYSETLERWLQSGLASFLEISAKEIAITRVEEGSTKITVAMPPESVERLLEAFRSQNMELLEYISPYRILDINPLRLKGEWYSPDNLKIAWNYAKRDIADDFVFDVIDYADIKSNIERVLNMLNAQIRGAAYYPAPLTRIEVPKSSHSFRPGTTIPLIDLIYLYAIAQQLAPALDAQLSASAYAYRLNPSAHKSTEPLFRDRERDEKQGEAIAGISSERNADDLSEDEIIEFPYNWFVNWKAFHDAGKAAVEEFKYVAVTDITAFFENISLGLLREQIKEILGVDDEKRELVDRLFSLLEYWAWNPKGNLPKGMGLPQGNDVSSFLSNVYLLRLDKEMLAIASSQPNKYIRYIDDLKLFTRNRPEAQRALVASERVLRELNLHTQSAKTRIEKSASILDEDVEGWMERMSNEREDKSENARAFLSESLEADKIDHWQRAYLRCLTVLREAGDPSAINTALALFLTNPSNRLLVKNFLYLRSFVTEFSYSDSIFRRLSEDTFTFPYHRGYMYRLSAYCRDEHEGIKNMALQEATTQSSDWFCRMASLFSASTFALSGSQLSLIAPIIQTEAHPLVTRAAYVTMCQHSGDSLRGVIERLNLFSVSHQEYLRRYFSSLNRDPEQGGRFLRSVERAQVSAPTFVFNLHQLDLLKANSKLRDEFMIVITRKIAEAKEKKGERLRNRLQKIYDEFVVHP
jgi:retron-type reverse transcriptase